MEENRKKEEKWSSRRVENGKSCPSLLLVAGLSFDLAALPGEMMFVGGSKSREGRREWQGREGDQDQESAKFARLLPAYPIALRWQFLGLLTLPSRQIDRQPTEPDRIAGKQSNLGDREKFLRLGETAAVAGEEGE